MPTTTAHACGPGPPWPSPAGGSAADARDGGRLWIGAGRPAAAADDERARAGVGAGPVLFPAGAASTGPGSDGPPDWSAAGAAAGPLPAASARSSVIGFVTARWVDTLLVPPPPTSAMAVTSA